MALVVAILLSVGFIALVSGSLVAENGAAVLLLAAVPLLISLAVTGLLWTRDLDRGAGSAAWMLVGVLGLVMTGAVLTVGPVIFPILAALAIACGVRQGRRAPARV